MFEQLNSDVSECSNRIEDNCDGIRSRCMQIESFNSNLTDRLARISEMNEKIQDKLYQVNKSIKDVKDSKEIKDAIKVVKDSNEATGVALAASSAMSSLTSCLGFDCDDLEANSESLKNASNCLRNFHLLQQSQSELETVAEEFHDALNDNNYLENTSNMANDLEQIIDKLNTKRAVADDQLKAEVEYGQEMLEQSRSYLLEASKKQQIRLEDDEASEKAIIKALDAQQKEFDSANSNINAKMKQAIARADKRLSNFDNGCQQKSGYWCDEIAVGVSSVAAGITAAAIGNSKIKSAGITTAAFVLGAGVSRSLKNKNF